MNSLKNRNDRQKSPPSKKPKLNKKEEMELTLQQYLRNIEKLAKSKKKQLKKLKQKEQEIIHNFDSKISEQQQNVKNIKNEMKEMNYFHCGVCHCALSDVDSDDEEDEIIKCDSCGYEVCDDCWIECPGWCDEKCCIKCLEQSECGKKYCSSCMISGHDNLCRECWGNKRRNW